MAKVSPLHKVIDTGRWDAEGLLGRLVIVVHAAFLDAGFVPLPLDPGVDGPVPVEAGRTASALSLRYTAPQLQHRRIGAVLRHQVYGRKIALYVQCDGRPAALSWLLVDALDAAPLLSGGLDATARALRHDAGLAALWRGLSDVLCRPALVDLCQLYGVVLEPTFVSLPGDAKAAILCRVECTCTALRHFVAERDRQLWKPRYEALVSYFTDEFGRSPETSWKERYVSLLHQWRYWYASL